MESTRKSTAISHSVRCRTGGTVEIGSYTRGKAIRLFCTECMGFQGSLVKDCTDPLCPLYPFRKATQAAYGKERT
jgi:hypothetical protein